MSASSSVSKNDLPEPTNVSFDIPWWRGVVVVALAGITIWMCLSFASVHTMDESGVVMELPSSIGLFWGVDQPVSESERVILPKDTEFAKKQYQTSGDQINCQIVLTGAQKQSIHRPQICLPGQGWNIQGEEIIPITLKDGKVLEVTLLTISRPYQVGGVRKELTSYFIYWFVGKDASTPRDWVRIFKTSWDRVFNRTNHRWAYVIVSAPILQGFTPNGKDAAETLEMLKEFIRDAVPAFMISEGATKS